MAKIFLLSSVGSRFAPVFASTAAHVAVFAAVAGGHASAARSALPQELEIAVDVVPAVAPATESPVLPSGSEELHEHAFHHHTHPYPVPFDHDEHPHDPRIDHRTVLPVALPLSQPANVSSEPLAAPAPAVVTAADDVPHFSMALGQGTTGWGPTTAGGDGSGVAPGASHGPGITDADEPLPESGVSERARLLAGVRPDYPARARAAEAEADVTLEIVVDVRGNVTDERVIGGAGFGFNDAAREAVHHYHFTPARRAGQAVRVRMPWTVQFRLQ
jgi:protein TonB